MNKVKNKLIIALDVDTFEEAEKLVKELKGLAGMFKVGKQLFTRCGPKIIEMIKKHKCKVFLDLKYHDIPNTVEKATAAAAELGVDMVNVHALGGSKMMKAAAKGAQVGARKAGYKKPLVIGVTILTSIDNSILTEELKILGGVKERVEQLSFLAKEAGLDGVVASPMEVASIKQICGNDFITVTPGVRPTWANKDDQARCTTPNDAMQMGTDFIVVGRPITKADNRKKAAQMILDDMVI